MWKCVSASSSRKCFVWTISQLKNSRSKSVYCIFRHYILLNAQTAIKIKHKLECVYSESRSEVARKKSSHHFLVYFRLNRSFAGTSPRYFCHILPPICATANTTAHHVFSLVCLFSFCHIQSLGFSSLLLTFLVLALSFVSVPSTQRSAECILTSWFVEYNLLQYEYCVWVRGIVQNVYKFIYNLIELRCVCVLSTPWLMCIWVSIEWFVLPAWVGAQATHHRAFSLSPLLCTHCVNFHQIRKLLNFRRQSEVARNCLTWKSPSIYYYYHRSQCVEKFLSFWKGSAFENIDKPAWRTLFKSRVSCCVNVRMDGSEMNGNVGIIKIYILWALNLFVFVGNCQLSAIINISECRLYVPLQLIKINVEIWCAA